MTNKSISMVLLSFALTMMLMPTFVPSVEAGRRETIVYYRQEDKWTLLMQVHAPQYGETSGTTTWGYSARFSIGQFGTFSSVSHSVTLFPYDGRCCARFQLCRWEYQYVLVEQGPFNGHDVWYEERWKIVQTFGEYLTINIYDGSRSRCSDDLQSFSYDGYESVEFESRYVNAEKTETNPSDSWIEREVSAGWWSFIAASIFVAVEVDGLTGTGSFRLRNDWWTTWTYKYRFGPHHSWYYDYLGSTQCIWTFYTRW